MYIRYLQSHQTLLLTTQKETVLNCKVPLWPGESAGDRKAGCQNIPDFLPHCIINRRGEPDGGKWPRKYCFAVSFDPASEATMKYQKY